MHLGRTDALARAVQGSLRGGLTLLSNKSAAKIDTLVYRINHAPTAPCFAGAIRKSGNRSIASDRP